MNTDVGRITYNREWEVRNECEHGPIGRYSKLFTFGVPLKLCALTPPCLSAFRVLHDTASMSVSPPLYPAFGTLHDGFDELPPFDSRASMGGFDTASAFFVVVRNVSYGADMLTREVGKEETRRTCVERKLPLDATAALRAALSMRTWITSGLSSS